ncbi:hypothetical protein TNCV_2760551 [Trichonephila clavipes]|nr:hypothetical protein TNCV_2760551 [Trichonephila clavipes]
MEKEKWYLDILKLSMIPGIAAVIETKKCSMFSFRLCVLLCAVTGFVWQTKVLVEDYLSRRAARPFVRLVEGEDRWEAPDHQQSVLLKIRVEASKNVVLPARCSKLRLSAGVKI